VHRTLLVLVVLFLSPAAGLMAAQGDGGAPPTSLTHQVVMRYASLRAIEYQHIVAAAQQLKEDIDGFLLAPSAAGLAGVRLSWVHARRAYSPSECHRFYGGPIDEPVADLENRINPWPIDESYIDYVVGDPGSGIINHPEQVPIITVPVLCVLNLHGGEKNIATGFHAIEFLLWGQGREARGPGIRSFADYVPGPPAVARRRAYLRATAQLLVADLSQVAVQWDPARPGTFQGRFIQGDPGIALQDIFTGMSSLCGDEMACERMAVAYETRSMEDGQSCFSCTSLDDLIDDQAGIQATYLGRGRDGGGPSPSALVALRDALLDQQLRAQLADTLAALRAIPGPFASAIQGPDGSPGRVMILAVITALEQQRRLLVSAAQRLGVVVGPGVDSDSGSRPDRSGAATGQPDD